MLSQLKTPSLYHFHAVFEVYPPSAQSGIPIDAQRLAKAWQRVVDYHGALRTVFADSVYKGDIFNQIVVNSADSGIILLQCDGGEPEALEKLESVTILDGNYKKQPRLPHQAVICQTSSGKVYFKAEINHVVIDGASVNILLRDLTAAYHGTLPGGVGPLYSNYIAYIKGNPADESIKFWKSYLEGAQACYFPNLNTASGDERRLGSVTMSFDRYAELQDMCKKINVTLANLMQVSSFEYIPSVVHRMETNSKLRWHGASVSAITLRQTTFVSVISHQAGTSQSIRFKAQLELSLICSAAGSNSPNNRLSQKYFGRYKIITWIVLNISTAHSPKSSTISWLDKLSSILPSQSKAQVLQMEWRILPFHLNLSLRMIQAR